MIKVVKMLEGDTEIEQSISEVKH